MRRTRSPLLKLLVVNGLIGAGAALALVAALVAADAHGLRRLLLGDDVPWVAVAMLVLALTVTLSSVAMGAAVMLLPRGEDDGPRGSAPAPAEDLVPVRLSAAAQHRR